MSRTLSGLFLVGALNKLRKRKGTNRENPRTIPEQIGKIPEKSGKSKKDNKGQKIGHGEVRVYRGTGVSRGVRRTTWDRSLKNWEPQIPCFEEFFWVGNTLGLVPASIPHTLGYACTFYAPTSPPPKKEGQVQIVLPALLQKLVGDFFLIFRREIWKI